jgi:hypothetical protein
MNQTELLRIDKLDPSPINGSITRTSWGASIHYRPTWDILNPFVAYDRRGDEVGRYATLISAAKALGAQLLTNWK